MDEPSPNKLVNNGASLSYWIGNAYPGVNNKNRRINEKVAGLVAGIFRVI